jgi:hypothetical protein
VTLEVAKVLVPTPLSGMVIVFEFEKVVVSEIKRNKIKSITNYDKTHTFKQKMKTAE